MTNGDPEGRILLSYPHTNNGSFFLLTAVIYLFIYLFIYLLIYSFKNKLREYAKTSHDDLT